MLLCVELKTECRVGGWWRVRALGLIAGWPDMVGWLGGGGEGWQVEGSG